MKQSMPTKIMQISSMKIWAGGEVHVVLLCNELMKLGINVTLACRPGTFIDKNAREAHIPVINQPFSGAIDLKSARELAKYCEAHSIEIIHAHTGRDYWLAVWTKFFYPKIRIVITRHIQCPLKNSMFHRWAYQKVDKVIAVSQAVRKSLTSFPSEKITTIYNGIDIERFKTAKPGVLRKKLAVSETTKIIGMIGRITPIKGQDTFFRSISDISSKVPDTVFVVAGACDDKDYIEKLKRINNTVIFLGMCDNVPEIMKDLDVFVLASLEEPFGLVTVEALAAGIPVVATNTGGTTEIITDGETGLLIPPEDPSKMAEAVITILSDPDLANQFRANGLNRVESFTIKKMTLSTLAVYSEALDNI
ncbi:glycosyltransferase involved in cell wall biosynthesis [Anaerospora hongkongensis]|uniref:Glycosyltransferase involved in cell wall biosynthesis n=1 Tax=Anaerospora hongkongensis TaxID=244830 RepID=A0A4R1PXV1_9FIRM|nr:GT4 family glycosyltransferase PelF [Anaerospora hongkongensis]TCL36082.1 glycosyltransferase involved in cell wall biosynthesis [Anaerospora hongkongensis]